MKKDGTSHDISVMLHSHTPRDVRRTELDYTICSERLSSEGQMLVLSGTQHEWHHEHVKNCTTTPLSPSCPCIYK